MVNTFHKKSIPTFLDLPENITNIYAYIIYIAFIGYGGININHQIINSYVFNLTEKFLFLMKITGIEKGVFKSFKMMTSVSLVQRYWKNLFHKGIDWTYDLNSNVYVDLNNSALIHEYFVNDSLVTIFSSNTFEEITEDLEKYDILPDKNFCIYAKFPFEQMIFMSFGEIAYNYDKVTCTLLWMFYPKHLLNEKKKYPGNRIQ